MSKMREEFENAWRAARLSERYSNEHIKVEVDSFCQERNKYGYSDIQNAWFFWQASRKALVVELPKSPKINSGDEFFEGVLGGHDTCKRKVIEALDAAGVSYR